MNTQLNSRASLAHVQDVAASSANRMLTPARTRQGKLESQCACKRTRTRMLTIGSDAEPRALFNPNETCRNACEWGRSLRLAAAAVPPKDHTKTGTNNRRKLQPTLKAPCSNAEKNTPMQSGLSFVAKASCAQLRTARSSFTPMHPPAHTHTCPRSGRMRSLGPYSTPTKPAHTSANGLDRSFRI